MARIPVPLSIVDTLAVSPPLLNAVQASFGPAADLFRLAGETPATPNGLHNLRKALEQGRLPAATRDRITLAVQHYSEDLQCDRLMSSNEFRLGRCFGDTKSQVGIKFALRLIQQRGCVDEADLADVKRIGYSSVELLEIVGHVALNALTKYINEVFGTGSVPLEPEAARAA